MLLCGSILSDSNANLSLFTQSFFHPDKDPIISLVNQFLEKKGKVIRRLCSPLAHCLELSASRSCRFRSLVSQATLKSSDSCSTAPPGPAR